MRWQGFRAYWRTNLSRSWSDWRRIDFLVTLAALVVGAGVLTAVIGWSIETLTICVLVAVVGWFLVLVLAVTPARLWHESRPQFMGHIGVTVARRDPYDYGHQILFRVTVHNEVSARATFSAQVTQLDGVSIDGPEVPYAAAWRAWSNTLPLDQISISRDGMQMIDLAVANKVRASQARSMALERWYPVWRIRTNGEGGQHYEHPVPQAHVMVADDILHTEIAMQLRIVHEESQTPVAMKRIRLWFTEIDDVFVPQMDEVEDW